MSSQNKPKKCHRFQWECFGCAECTGVCYALIEFLVVPDVVIKSGYTRNG